MVSAVLESCRLFLRDRHNGIVFFIDSGRDISVLPFSQFRTTRKPSSLVAFLTNNTPNNTYGEINMTIDFNLARKHPWCFIIANCTCPIIEANFLSHYDLVVDLTRKRLVRGTTLLSTLGTVLDCAHTSISVLDELVCADVRNLLRKFPLNLSSNNFVHKPSHTIKHHIETTGAPVFARARQIAPDKYRAAKKNSKNSFVSGFVGPQNHIGPVLCY